MLCQAAGKADRPTRATRSRAGVAHERPNACKRHFTLARTRHHAAAERIDAWITRPIKKRVCVQACFGVNVQASKREAMTTMDVLVLASGKGGVGKTTLAAHLAVAATDDGCGPVALIDTDPQASLADWWNEREAETPAFVNTTLDELPEKLAALSSDGYRLAIIDTPPSVTDHILTVVRAATFVLIPIKPSPHDLRAVGRTVDIVEKAGAAFGFVVTQAKTNAVLTAQAVAALSEYGAVAPAIIGDRVDFAASMVDGRTVGELVPKGKSTQDIRGLWAFTRARLPGLTQAIKLDRKKAR